MLIESKPFAPDQRGEVFAVFSLERRATGVFMDAPTGSRFVVERIDRLTGVELARLALGGLHLVGLNGHPQHGLRVAVHYARPAVDDRGQASAIFRAQVDLEADVAALEHHLGFVVERGIRDAHNEAQRQRRKG